MHRQASPLQLPAAVLRPLQARRCALRAHFAAAVGGGAAAGGAAAETEWLAARAEVARLYRDTGVAKAGAAWAYAARLLDSDPGAKLLVFAHHIEAADPQPPMGPFPPPARGGSPPARRTPRGGDSPPTPRRVRAPGSESELPVRASSCRLARADAGPRRSAGANRPGARAGQ